MVAQGVEVTVQAVFRFLLLTAGGHREVAFGVKGGLMPPFVTQSTFWIFVIALTLILIFVFGIDVSSN
jgi:hypothetical protein